MTGLRTAAIAQLNPGDQVLRMTAPPLLRVGDRALLSPRRDAV